MKQYRRDLIFALLVFVVALVVRGVIAAPIWAGDLGFHTGDDDDYYRIAISLVQHGTFAIEGVPTAYRMPLFPLFAAFWHRLFGIQPYAILPVLLGLGALIPVGTYLLGRSVVGQVGALFAGLLTAFDLDLSMYSRFYMTETLFCVTVVGGLLAANRLRVTRRWPWAVVLGLCFGCATITRANFGPFVAVALLWIIWYGRDQVWPTMRRVAVVSALVLALWTPWVVRNSLVFGTLIPFTTQGGSAYYGLYSDVATQNNPLGYGFWLWRIPHPPARPGHVWTEVELDQYQREEAFTWIRANPGQALMVALMQLVYLWIPDNDLVSWLLTVGIGLPTLLIFALRRHQPEFILWLTLVATMSALAVVSVGVARYQFPLRPILAVMATMFIMNIVQSFVTLRQRRTSV